MKIQYMSDLHLEFGDMPVPDVFGDVLILAGDIHVGMHALAFIQKCCNEFEHVIYILGNHEFYNKTMHSVIAEWKTVDIPNFHFLDNDYVNIEGINFIGSTLWSKAHPNCPLNDFRLITYKHQNGNYTKFSTSDAKDLHINNVNYLIDNIKEKTIVITHHAPSWKAQAPWYNDTIVGSGFNTDILDNFDSSKILFWIYGHTHYNTEFIENGIKVVSNQRGYKEHELLHDFDPNKYIEV